MVKRSDIESFSIQDLPPLSSITDVRFTGPPLEDGPLPAVIYFALSARESLQLDPINQPVQFLPRDKIRVFSLTLPGHGPGFLNKKAMQYWASKLADGTSLAEMFLSDTLTVLDFLLSKKWINEKVYAAGLSRGGFAALHLAARSTIIKGVATFSSVTNLQAMPEFSLVPSANNYSLFHSASSLVGKPLFFSIGNNDERVDTQSCIELCSALIKANKDAGKRHIPVELHVFPSVGNKGHGTPPERFANGAQWLEQQLFSS